MLQVNCPNVDELSLDEILETVTESNLVPSAKKRYQILDLLYSRIFNFNLEKDLILSVLDESDKKLILAPAGAGKTTTVAGAELILQKIYRKSVIRYYEKNGKRIPKLINGDNMLCLVYNKHNVGDIKKRHHDLVSQIKLSGLGDIDHLNDDLRVFTMHGFCSAWVTEYKDLCNLKRFELITEESEEQNLMTQCIKAVLDNGSYGISPKEVKVSNLMKLYNLKRETMLEYNNLLNTDAFIDINMPLNSIIKIFDTYEDVKKIKRKYDFTDQLLIFNRLLRGDFNTTNLDGTINNENEKVLERLRDCYEYITADELQDFTTLMMEILVRISKGIHLTCIGDDDQSLYGFKGADSNNILKFSEKFPESKIFLLKTNRRCPRNVVDLSKFIIGKNELRFDKDIKSIKPDGEIIYRPYTDRRGQFLSVLSDIKAMNSSERSSTCVCYRNQECSAELGNMLMESGIHFHMLSGVMPFTYGLYRTAVEVLRLLQGGSNKKLHLNLYKCLPIKKDELYTALKYDPQKNLFKDNNQIMHLSEIDFGARMNNQRFVQELNFLIQVSRGIDSISLSDYFPRLLQMIKTYYWDYIVELTGRDVETDKSFNKSVLKYFSVDKTFPAKFTEYERDKRILEKDQRSGAGICVSTYHSLKGLEKDNVILIDLQESIFPNTMSIDCRPYDDETKQKLKEGETRLFYVAITRTKKKLIMYYHRTDPSVFITMIFNEYKKPSYEKNLDSLNTELLISNSFTNKVVEEPDVDGDYDFDLEDSTEPEVVTTVKENTPTETIKEKTPEKKPESDYRSMIMDVFFG